VVHLKDLSRDKDLPQYTVESLLHSDR